MNPDYTRVVWNDYAGHRGLGDYFDNEADKSNSQCTSTSHWCHHSSSNRICWQPTFGLSWMQEANARFPGRIGQASVIMLDGSVLSIGGEGSGVLTNSVYTLAPGGEVLSQTNRRAGFSARKNHCAVRLLGTDNVVVIGGNVGPNRNANDAWISYDKGATFTQQASQVFNDAVDSDFSNWIDSHFFQCVSTSDTSIVIFDKSARALRSDDSGVTWSFAYTASDGTTLTGDGCDFQPPSARSNMAVTYMPTAEKIVMVGGTSFSTNDVLSEVWTSEQMYTTEGEPSYPAGMCWAQVLTSSTAPSTAHAELVTLPDTLGNEVRRTLTHSTLIMLL